jgi:putative transposase
VVVRFIHGHKARFGVEPICRVLSEHGCKISPSTYYAHRSRPPSARAVRDIAVLAEITRVHSSRTIGRGLYGARKVWHQLAREGLVVPRCQVERLMRAAGLRGIRRGRQFITTRPDPGAVRPPDLVKRDFTAPAPNVLWVVDFTYVPTWSGMAFTAFVTDVFSRRIIGWRTAASMPTELPLDALEMALWTRGRAGQPTGQVIHHSDAPSTPLSAMPAGSWTPAPWPRSARSAIHMTTPWPSRPSAFTRLNAPSSKDPGAAWTTSSSPP